jgi:hypothetical protein
MTNAEKAAAIGGGAKPDYEDNSCRSWPCGCYEDQHGYHLCDRGHPLRAEALAPPDDGWQPIATCPHDADVFFWLVPKTADESYTDTSGKPIVSDHAPYWKRGRWLSWGALSKPTHWRPMFAPPRADAREAPQEEKAEDKTTESRGGSL